MKPTQCASGAMTRGLIAGAMFALSLAAARAAGPEVAIEARLFGSKTGKLGENVLAERDRLLGNVIIGEDPSTSTLVTVRVVSSQPLRDGARIRLIATEMTSKSGRGRPHTPTRRVLDSSADIPGRGGEDQAVYVGFWLPQTGCAPIALRAELLSPPVPKVEATATLDFNCYE